MFKLIWSNISRRRNQSLLTIAITTLTVLSFVTVLGVFLTMSKGLAASHDRLGADCMVIPKDANADGYEMLFTANPENVYMDEDILDQVGRLDGIAKISPQFFSQTLSGGCCDFGSEMRVVGIDTKTDFTVSAQLNIKDYNKLGDDEIILGGEFTDFVGKKSRVLDNVFYVAGELYPTGTGMDKTIYMTMDTARRITIESPNLILPEGVDLNHSISAIMIKLEPGVDGARFANDFNLYSGINAQCISASDTVVSLEKQLKATMKVLFGLWLATLIIAILALIGRFNALAKDRKKEIGLMRAIGVRKKDVFFLVLGEACTMSLIGGVVGSLIAGIILKPVMSVITETFQLPASTWSLGLTILCILIGIVLAIILGILASISPAARSAALEPQTAITQGEVN